MVRNSQRMVFRVQSAHTSCIQFQYHIVYDLKIIEMETKYIRAVNMMNFQITFRKFTNFA
jgi:hypothetical protein